VRLDIRNKTGGTFQSRNVIADVRGREKPDEIVLIGAHLDSWDLGTGAEDNGVNAVMLIDALRGFIATHARPRRTLRFALFTGEEYGMFGSAGYVLAHGAEMDNHVAVIMFDTGSGRLNGFFLNGREELRRPVDEALSVLAGFSANAHLPDGIDGTDNYDFALSGVPNLVGNQDTASYLPDYHSESDTLDKSNIREEKITEAIASALLWGFAERPERAARRQNRQEVEKLLKETKLDEQMKALGQWDDFVSGKRGVSK
jgi:Zn-dependent M28 family amino/carboxypeptidase